MLQAHPHGGEPDRHPWLPASLVGSIWGAVYPRGGRRSRSLGCEVGGAGAPAPGPTWETGETLQGPREPSPSSTHLDPRGRQEGGGGRSISANWHIITCSLPEARLRRESDTKREGRIRNISHDSGEMRRPTLSYGPRRGPSNVLRDHLDSVTHVTRYNHMNTHWCFYVGQDFCQAAGRGPFYCLCTTGWRWWQRAAGDGGIRNARRRTSESLWARGSPCAADISPRTA